MVGTQKERQNREKRCNVLTSFNFNIDDGG